MKANRCRGGPVRNAPWLRRRLERRWQSLHPLIYLSGMPAALHFLWQVKAGNTIATLEPIGRAALYALLMLARLPEWLGKRRHDERTAQTGPASNARIAQ